MPRTPIERRDNTLLNAILEVQKDTSEIKATIAVNSTRIGNIEDHLKTLNGKVASQEVRQQEQASTQSLLAASITSLQQRDTAQENVWREVQRWAVRGMAVIVLMLFWWILKQNGFPDFFK